MKRYRLTISAFVLLLALFAAGVAMKKRVTDDCTAEGSCLVGRGLYGALR